MLEGPDREENRPRITENVRTARTRPLESRPLRLKSPARPATLSLLAEPVFVEVPMFASDTAPLRGSAIYRHYNRLHDRVCSWIRGSLNYAARNDDDLIAEGVLRVFLVLREHVDAGAEFPTGDHLRNFLSATVRWVVRGLSRDWCLALRNKAIPFEEEAPPAGEVRCPSSENQAAAREALARIAEAAPSLSPSDQLLLRGLAEEEPFEELGERLGRSAVSVRVSAHRLRHRLREHVPAIGEVLRSTTLGVAA